VMKWRRLRSGMGSPPEPAVPAYRRFRMPWKRPQVLGADLNRSESGQSGTPFESLGKNRRIVKPANPVSNSMSCLCRLVPMLIASSMGVPLGRGSSACRAQKPRHGRPWRDFAVGHSRIASALPGLRLNQILPPAFGIQRIDRAIGVARGEQGRRVSATRTTVPRDGGHV